MATSHVRSDPKVASIAARPHHGPLQEADYGRIAYQDFSADSDGELDR